MNPLVKSVQSTRNPLAIKQLTTEQIYEMIRMEATPSKRKGIVTTAPDG